MNVYITRKTPPCSENCSTSCRGRIECIHEGLPYITEDSIKKIPITNRYMSAQLLKQYDIHLEKITFTSRFGFNDFSKEQYQSAIEKRWATKNLYYSKYTLEEKLSFEYDGRRSLWRKINDTLFRRKSR